MWKTATSDSADSTEIRKDANLTYLTFVNHKKHISVQ